MAGLSVARDGSWCGGGEFTVRDLNVVGSTVVSFAAEFEHTCGFPPAVVLSGSVQYNSLFDKTTTTLSVEPATLRFAALHNGASVTTQPSAQSVRVIVGGAHVGWSAVASQPWIQLSPASGTGTTTMNVSANVLGSTPGSGSASGTITVTLTNGTGTSRTVNLAVALLFNGTTAPPIGLVDTPQQNITGVTGAIPDHGLGARRHRNRERDDLSRAGWR